MLAKFCLLEWFAHVVRHAQAEARSRCFSPVRDVINNRQILVNFVVTNQVRHFKTIHTAFQYPATSSLV